MCLRLARPRDLQGVCDLYRRLGREREELGAARLVNFDLVGQLVLCATALIDSAELVLGIGAIDLDRPEEPVLVVVDEELTEGLGELLSGALVAHGVALVAGRAA